MLDAMILLMAVILGWFLLRSRGGKGMNIKFQLAPLSTSKGKKDHVTVWAAFSIMAAGIAFYFIRQDDADPIFLLVIPLILGALVALSFRR